MRNLKSIVVMLASVSLLSLQAHASDGKVKLLEGNSAMDFNHSDMSAIFENADQPMQVTILSKQEMKETEGALMYILMGAGLGAAGGVGMYALNSHINDRPMTWQGTLYSAGTGALIGAGGTALIGAAGGGVAANIAWRPNMIAANYGLGQYRRYREW